MFAENLGAFLDPNGFAVTAVFGAHTANVLLDQHDEDVLHGRAQSTAYRMTFNPADLPGLVHNSALTVNGIAYVVHTVNKFDDGALNQAVIYQYP